MSALISAKATCTSVHVILFGESSTYIEASAERACAVFDELSWNLLGKAIWVLINLFERDEEVRLIVAFYQLFVCMV